MFYMLLAGYPASLGRKGVREGGEGGEGEGRLGGREEREGEAREGGEREGGREGGARAKLGFPPSLQPSLTASYTL